MEPSVAKQRLRPLLRSSEGSLPLGEVCLLISAVAAGTAPQVFPAVNVEAGLARLDALAADAPSSFAALMPHLFTGRHGWMANRQHYYAVSNSLLSEVLRTRQGIPISLSIVAIEIGRRCGSDVVGIGMPGHFLVHSIDDGDLFADPFDRGQLMNREDARALFGRLTHGTGRWHDSYLRPVSDLQIVQRTLNNLAVAARKQPFADIHLPWVLEVMSWLPGGAPFDPREASRAVAIHN
ncbi:MAG TPA: transglutaminase-like domain-containing protein [Ilumatobacteraceae bacterium]|nr:transglutaminase-like domain-containing protein [Ilumatobacteraceae bacterium]